MTRTNLVVTHRSGTARTALKFIVLGLALTAGSISAHALPHFGVHRHPAAAQDSRTSLHLYNKAPLFRDVAIDGQVYTVLPHQSITVKAPAGTAIFAASTGGFHHKGDLLFTVAPQMQDSTLSIN